MTIDAQLPFLPEANHAFDALAERLIQPGTPRGDRGGALGGLPAGPGLSAVEMAAACLCFADPGACRQPVRQVPTGSET